MATEQASYPLPDDPLLADTARAMRDDGAWGQLVDAEWNLVYVPSAPPWHSTPTSRTSAGSGRW